MAVPAARDTDLRRLLLALALALVACAGDDPAVSVGRDAPELRGPEIAGEGLTGRTIDLDDLHDRPVLVNFWASWCGPCRQEIPRFNALHDRGVAVLGVDVGEGPGAASRFLSEFKVAWASIHDPDEVMAAKWSVGRGLPQTFAVDADGVIRGRHIGLASDADLAELVRVAG